MTKTPKDQELDDFHFWLQNQAPKVPPAQPLLPPDREWLDLAWRAAHAHQAYLINHGLVFSQRILPLAASDGTLKNAPARFIGKLPESIGGEWSLTREDLPQDPDWQILKFKCREELIETIFRGRSIDVRIGDKKFSLGKVDRRGLAEAEIPRGLDLQQEIEVRFGANKE
ncbi:MAG: hypothetical protein Q8L68_00500 [Methylococcales bacterium]|nr:hypothetical protein [Methylococcales bacterium]